MIAQSVGGDGGGGDGGGDGGGEGDLMTVHMLYWECAPDAVHEWTLLS